MHLRRGGPAAEQRGRNLILIPPNAEVVLDRRAMGQSFTALTNSKNLGECFSLCKCNRFVFRTVTLQLTSAKHQNPFPASGGCCSRLKGQQMLFSPVLLTLQVQASSGGAGQSAQCSRHYLWVQNSVLQLQLRLSPQCKSEGRTMCRRAIQFKKEGQDFSRKLN